MGNTKNVSTRYTKILEHPDYEEIVEWIKQRKSVQYIRKELVERYPDDKKLQVGENTLYRFRGDNYREYSPQKKKSSYTEDDDDNLASRVMKLTGKERPPPREKQLFTDDQIRNWGTGYEGMISMVEELMFERGDPIELQDYQKDIFKQFYEKSRVVVCTGGQVGKDMSIDKYSVAWAILHPYSTQLVLCAVQDQSSELMRRTLFNMSYSEDLVQSKLSETFKPPPTIHFKNGARIVYFTAQSLVAGYTDVDIVWINEARDVAEKDVTRASPLLGIGGGSLYVLSRPRFRRGYFWDCYNNPAFHPITIPTESNKYFDRGVWEDDRNTLSPDLFRIEYLAQFADVGSSYFSETAIDNSCKEDWDWKSIPEKAESDYDYSVGIDWARLRDTSVFTVLGKHKKSDNIRLFHTHAFSPDKKQEASFEAQFGYLRYIHDRFNFTYLVPESSGMGIPLAERLQDEWRREIRHGRVEPYENRSFQAKLALYEEAKRKVETGRIQLPRSAFELINQLKLTQFGSTVHGNLKVETPITDDYADSFCLSVWPFKKPFKMGVGLITRDMVDPMAGIRSRG